MYIYVHVYIYVCVYIYIYFFKGFKVTKWVTHCLYGNHPCHFQLGLNMEGSPKKCERAVDSGSEVKVSKASSRLQPETQKRRGWEGKQVGWGNQWKGDRIRAPQESWGIHITLPGVSHGGRSQSSWFQPHVDTPTISFSCKWPCMCTEVTQDQRQGTTRGGCRGAKHAPQIPSWPRQFSDASEKLRSWAHIGLEQMLTPRAQVPMVLFIFL